MQQKIIPCLPHNFYNLILLVKKEKKTIPSSTNANSIFQFVDDTIHGP